MDGMLAILRYERGGNVWRKPIPDVSIIGLACGPPEQSEAPKKGGLVFCLRHL